MNESDANPAASLIEADLLSKVSHQVRTPLNAILGMSQLALREDGLPGKVREYLEAIETAAHQLVDVANNISDLSDASDRQQRKTPTVQHSLSHPLKVLLAEDVDANQTIVTRLLEGQGHEVVVASNGQEAVEQFHRTEFDVVLMDVQMPVLDGYTATAEIRKADKVKTGQTPIIGMTAHATQKVRDECLRAGMDEYLPKPIDLDTLVSVLNRVSSGPDHVSTSDCADRMTSPNEDSTLWLNIDCALRRLGGDVELFREFVEVFDEDCPKLCAEIREGFKNENRNKVSQAAHKLQGLSVNLGAESIRNIASQLEQACESNDLRGAQRFIVRLDDQLSRLNRELDKYR